ncbi:MAG TPA: FAD-dependent thymidylate synthase [Patescibacteria group bacterium]|nr:FAD-dependent thymidylate synthase [Patescibacteria group bacterium]
MGTRRGAFIVIEGTDGSGKGTQFELLRNRLSLAGYLVESFDFPQYDQPSSYFVSQYLNGKYGSAEAVGPYTASLFYALDRFEAAPRIRKALDEGKIVISNRFTGSSMGHQGTKFRSAEERRGYFIWLDNLEFEMLHIPRPDISFVLRVPADVAQQLVDQKPARGYTDKKRDIHEADLTHLEGALAVYDDMTQLFPKDFQRIDCVRGGKLLDVETIQSMLWEKVAPLLPQPPQLEMPMPIATPAVTAEVAEPEDAAEAPEQAAATPIEQPGAAVTDPEGDVYAFTAKLPPAIVAAVIASLSRSGGSLSTTVLEEFAAAATKDQATLSRTVQSYSEVAPRLVSQHVVASHTSGLLAATIQAGRQATYVTPQTRYLHYEQKDANGMYKYHLPTDLPEKVAVQYRQHLDRIFDTYADMLPKLSAYMQQASGVPVQGRSNEWQAAMHAEAHSVLQAVLPLAATSTVALYGSAQTLGSDITRLLSSPLPEAQSTGQKVLQELRKTIPAFIEDPSAGGKGESEITYRQMARQAVAKFAADFLPAAHAAEAEQVHMTNVWPRNELELVPDMLYEHSNLPLSAIQKEVATWSYTRKLSVFEAYAGNRLQRRERPGRALEKAHYSWDITCDYNVLCELLHFQQTESLEWQLFTPRYGYTVPAIIEAAELSDQFEDCFDTSLALYSILQQASNETTAQYATLRGHKLRLKLTYNAREAFRIHEACTALHASPELRALAEQLHDRLSETHPLIGEAMLFVGQ